VGGDRVACEGEDSCVMLGKDDGISLVVAPLTLGEGLLPIVDLFWLSMLSWLMGTYKVEVDALAAIGN